MVSPTMKQKIEGAAERLSRTHGRVVSEAAVIRAAIEQTDFTKLALTAAPAPAQEVQRERTTLTPEQAAIIEAGVFPSYFIAGGEPGPVKIYPGFPPAEIPDEVYWQEARAKTIAETKDAIEKIEEHINVDSQVEPVRTDVHYVCQLPVPEWLPCAMHHPNAELECIYCTTTKITTVLTEAEVDKFRHFEPGPLGDYALKIREAQESALRERPE
jgi:hypothetical protein